MKTEEKSFYVAVFVLIIVLVMLTLLDVFVIKYFWLRNRTTSFGSDLPWFWWLPFWMMQLIFPLSASLLLSSKIPLVSYILFVTGIEDTLFHVIAWQSVPEIYYGIYLLGVLYSPAREIVLMANSIGVFTSIVCVYALTRRCRIHAHKL